MSKFWLLIGAVALITAAILVLENPFRPKAMLEAPPGVTETVGTQVGLVAPDFQLEQLRDGAPIRLSDLRGKAVFLNFWASWCPFCIDEMPDMQRVYDELKDQGFEVLAVNRGEPKAPALDYIDATLPVHVMYPLLFDPQEDVSRVYILRGMPVSYFIDREGRITARFFGPIPYETMRAEALKALGEDA